MPTRVERYRRGAFGHVLVRVAVTHHEVRPDLGHLLRVQPAFDRTGPRPDFFALVCERDVVAMMVDDDRYAWASQPAGERGDPNAATLVWDARGARLAMTADAHADPFGEARYVVVGDSMLTGSPSRPRWLVLDRDQWTVADGIYDDKATALERAADLNEKDSAR